MKLRRAGLWSCGVGEIENGEKSIPNILGIKASAEKRGVERDGVACQIVQCGSNGGTLICEKRGVR
jgi:hypothetical protein